MLRIILIAACMFAGLMGEKALAQLGPDTSGVPVRLPDVLIQGFESNTKLRETPSSIGYVGNADLQRSAGTSLLPAVNTLPGVRMEERSPESYRFSIRGSLLGSPFGVMNIKMYWDDIPLTDASGNTYLNVLDMNTFGSVEVLKGPAGSMYGANTGGVVIFHGDTTPGLRVQLRGGTYGQYGEDALYRYRSAPFSNSFFQSHNQSDGYRTNSTSKKDVYQEWGQVRLSPKDQLDWLGLYTNLYYQTPGGLTLAQLMDNPRADRPNSSTLPGASAAHAAIFAQTWFAGLTNHYALGSHWTNATTLLASGTHFDNPFLTDYERRREQTLDALTKFIYDRKGPVSTWRMVIGGEYQFTQSNIHDYGNTHGSTDTTQSINRLQAFQFNPYVQADLRVSRRWLAQAGVSANTFHYHYLPLAGPDSAAGLQRIDFHLQVMPRISLQYALWPGALSVYATVSRGYSPPTIAEIFPGTALLYNNLQPEEGWNEEVGLKSFLWSDRLQLTLSFYDFQLGQTIVPRYDTSGHAYYVNTGSTLQKGLEAGVNWIVADRPGSWIPWARWFVSYSLQDYHFKNYLEGTVNYSGNPLTGVPPNVLVTGWDIRSRPGLYLNATYTYTDAIPLADAGTPEAASYQLVQAKLGWAFRVRRMTVDIFAGVDNALNQLYSLGDDFNAAGGRYYNPSAGRNYFGGCSVRF